MSINKINLIKVISFANSITEKVPFFLESVHIIKNRIIFYCKFQNLYLFLEFLKKHTYLQYSILIDITGVDYPFNKKRYELVYQLLSIYYNHRIMIKVRLNELISINSLFLLYKSSVWMEREIWDFFGIFFTFHPDLRRILTDYGFQGFPLRKDFPLTGFIELYYDDEAKLVVYESLELAQEFRFFDFQSPWKQY